MAEIVLNKKARKENSRALAVAAGLSEEDAARRLECKVLITIDDKNDASVQFAEEISPILCRTLGVSYDESEKDIAAEVVIGKVKPRTNGPFVFADLSHSRLSISTVQSDHPSSLPNSRLMTLIAACYASSAAIFCAVGHDMPNPPPKNFEIYFHDFLPEDFDLSLPVELGEAYMAGGGAIGNGFLWAGRYVQLHGKIHIADDDFVSEGNLQRQIWFDEEDVGKSKAEVLYNKAQPFFPNCTLVPFSDRLQNHPNKNDGAWLDCLIVGVDSRRARRSLQDELPGEVFDASTTESREIVLHHNKQPTEFACMSCVYDKNEAELSHESAVATHLGIDPSDMRGDRITPELAIKICKFHPQLQSEDIEGLAFESLYKQLCSSGQLKTLSGKQVIAPFAFVSVLAGALLLIEVIRHRAGLEYYNEWRVNPWQPPVPEIRQIRPKNKNCSCCENKHIQNANNTLWG